MFRTAHECRHLGHGVTPHLQERAIGYWTQVDADLGARVAAGLAGRNGSASGAMPSGAEPLEGTA